MNIESKEFQEYITSSVDAISKGLAKAGHEVNGLIEFNLAVANSSEGNAGLKLHVVGMGGKLKSEEISHISFKAQPISVRPARTFTPDFAKRNSSR